MAYYFLSGYLQNVIDFLRQDLSEVQDGTDPIYPSPEMSDDPGYLIVHVSPTSIYEVVAQSRSLAAGRPWIGTCPYLFLVHLMTLHNEDLVRRFEHKVRDLIDHLEQVRLLGTAGQVDQRRRDWHNDETFNRFRRFRLDTFEEVHRHRYFNVLRYDTERSIYESVEAVRGIQQREVYWVNVVAELAGMETAVDDLRNARAQRSDARRSRMLAAVAVIGVLQVAFDVLEIVFEKNATRVWWASGFTAAALVAALAIVWPLLRPKSEDKAS
ncbi:hypothetical protein [Actinokineospora globicatena]|uniref:Uncharacterized protein n=1 Tax=Actinokineospora globicatena TaxID=103729 RepID=A0A9W6V6P3_9PSEU|nr:hypothetical protein [Actinokineospora globicatena]GLW90587.1 hypothetical protein Aglo03_14030 [Actinokineospora globicatena]